MLCIVVGTNVSIAIVDVRETSLTGVKNSNNKNRLAASRLVDDAPAGRIVVGSNISIAIVDARKTSLTGVQNI